MPTNKATPNKKIKLRNAEYYDFQTTQDKLYQKSLEKKVFKNLINLITKPENIALAYRNIKRNSGSKTPGTDKLNISDLSKLSQEQLICIVQNKFNTYIPKPIRRVEIPKSNGKTRPLGIPTIMDRLIQQCILQVLEPICEAKFHNRSYGFRPNRSQEHAIAQTYTFMQKQHLHYVVDIDIKGFFDNVSHWKLLKQMWALGIRDKKLLSIISAMLKAEVAGIGFPEKGTPQGGILSPLLSNIVLNELDWWLASQWEVFPTQYPYSSYVEKNGSISNGNRYQSLRKSNLKEIWHVRYADDFKIFCKDYRTATKIFEATKAWLKDRLKLDVSTEKSKIVNLRTSYSEFLGFKIKLMQKGVRGKHRIPRYVVKSHVSDKALKNIKENCKYKIKRIQYADSSKVNEYNELSKYNAFVVGIHNYYKFATLISFDLDSLAFDVQKSLRNRLRDRIKKPKQMRHLAIRNRTCKFINSRYGASKQIRFVGGNAIAPIGYVRHVSPMYKKRSVNQYTEDGRKEIHKNLDKANLQMIYYLMKNPIVYRSIEFNDNRLALYSAQNGKCAVTGTVLAHHNLHCHHKQPSQYGGTDEYSNLILITKEVHRYIHSKNCSIKDSQMLSNLTKKQILKLNQLKKLANPE
jgi:group II intron reverse transcriptase/maturase